MFLIVSVHNNMILDKCENLITWENGYVESSETHIGYSSDDVTTFDVESIPNDFELYKYCYTPETGFYLNPDWKEPTENPYGLTDEQIETIEQAYRDRLEKEVAQEVSENV